MPLIVVTPKPKGSLGPLDGAESDAQAWTHFLATSEGGAWRKDEIKVLRNPTKAQVMIWLALGTLRKYDYALLTFSGHGAIVETIGGFLENRMLLNDTEYLTQRSFTMKTNRELLILDACREYKWLEAVPIEEQAIVKFAERRLDTRLADARRMFDSAIAISPAGRSYIYSCDLNQDAADHPSFIRVMINRSLKMTRAEKHRRVINVREVFVKAKTEMTAINFPQRPLYNGGRRLTHFPFAVSI